MSRSSNISSMSVQSHRSIDGIETNIKTGQRLSNAQKEYLLNTKEDEKVRIILLYEEKLQALKRQMRYT